MSALSYAEDIDRSNLFVVGACTKGLQAPGIRIGWVVAARKNISGSRNFSSFGMGGVSHPSQVYALELLKGRAGDASLGRRCPPSTGISGRVTAGLGSAVRLHGRGRLLSLVPAAWRPGRRGTGTRRLFKAGRGHPQRHGLRHDEKSRFLLRDFFRFSFGPQAGLFDSDIEILKSALRG